MADQIFDVTSRPAGPAGLREMMRSRPAAWTVLALVLLAAPVAPGAQPAAKVSRIGYLSSGSQWPR